MTQTAIRRAVAPRRIFYVAPGEDQRTRTFTSGLKDACASVGIPALRLARKERVVSDDAVVLYCSHDLDDAQFIAGVAQLRMETPEGNKVVAVATDSDSVSIIQKWLIQEFGETVPFLGAPQSGYVQDHQTLLAKLGVVNPVVVPPESEPLSVVDYAEMMIRDFAARALLDERPPIPVVPPRDGRVCATVREATVAQIRFCRLLMRSKPDESYLAPAVRKIVYYADERYRSCLQQITAEARSAGASSQRILSAFCDQETETAAMNKLRQRVVSDLLAPQEWTQRYLEIVASHPEIERDNIGKTIWIDVDTRLYAVVDDERHGLAELRARGGGQRVDRVFCRRIGTLDRTGVPAVLRGLD